MTQKRDRKNFRNISKETKLLTGVYTYADVLCRDYRVRPLQHWEELGIRVKVKANGQNFSSNEG